MSGRPIVRWPASRSGRRARAGTDNHCRTSRSTGLRAFPASAPWPCNDLVDSCPTIPPGTPHRNESHLILVRRPGIRFCTGTGAVPLQKRNRSVGNCSHGAQLGVIPTVTAGSRRMIRLLPAVCSRSLSANRPERQTVSRQLRQGTRRTVSRKRASGCNSPGFRSRYGFATSLPRHFCRP